MIIIREVRFIRLVGERVMPRQRADVVRKHPARRSSSARDFDLDLSLGVDLIGSRERES